MDLYGVGLDLSVKKLNAQFKLYVAKMKQGLPLRDLKKIFKQFDKNGNKKLDIIEFEQGLTSFGIFLKKYEYQILLKYYDKDGDNMINFEEFVLGLTEPLNERRKNIVLKAFNKLDIDKSGQITISELQGQIDAKHLPGFKQGKKTEQELLQEFIQQFEKNNDGKISKSEFLNYYQDLGIGITLDDYFVNLIENQWKICEDETKWQTQQEVIRCTKELWNNLFKASGGNKDDVLLKKLFREFDYNNDGLIQFIEFERILKKFNITTDKKNLTAVFNAIDVNRSGVIEFQEFQYFICHYANPDQ